jgi:1-deoxy-D-xylulose-5-phosphate synthase
MVDLVKKSLDSTVEHFGATKEFTDSVDINESYERYQLTEALIVEDIKNTLK